ncbi:MAG TPA: XdhC family protein [Chthoniobacterales bacterium]|nr:XdhC family protein [Chthoniobacterales bacterium]
MKDALLEELMAARQARTACALITVVGTRGSVPRAAGSKMLVYADGKVSGTIGGGKFESLVASDAQQQMREKQPLLKTYSLHECAPDSFGAICGGESTVFIEPQVLSEAIFLIGAGHCSLAISKLAVDCGLHATVLDDRAERSASFPPEVKMVSNIAPPQFIRQREWQPDEALVIVSRNYEIDRDALHAALEATGTIGYIGMIGSARKVQRVFEQLMKIGVSESSLKKVYAPIGLDINADAPAEIAVSVLAEIFSVLRNRDAKHLRRKLSRD